MILTLVGTGSFLADNSALLIANCFGFLATLATLWYQSWSADRQRRWDKEDIADLVKTTAKDQDKFAAETAVMLAEKTDEVHAQASAAREAIAVKLDEVGGLARDAYAEANQVNVKIVGLHEAGIEASRLAEAASDLKVKLESIDTTGLDTNDQVRKMTEALVHVPAPEPPERKKG